jgi:hypothetical protein
MRARFVITMAAIVAGLAVGGCGDDSTTTDAGTTGTTGAQGTPLSKSEFLAEGLPARPVRRLTTGPA